MMMMIALILATFVLFALMKAFAAPCAVLVADMTAIVIQEAPTLVPVVMILSV